MSNFLEIGRMISNLLEGSSDEGLTIWLVEEETGESVKLYDFINSEKHSEDATFKRINK
jgi:hypothetical protein